MAHTLQRVNIHQLQTLSSNIASAKDALEDVAAKIASTSVDAASLASQMASSDSDLTAASVVIARETQDVSKSENELMEVIDTLQRVISTALWKLSPQ